MIHLTDTQLNEYLDNALNAPSRNSVEAHLRSCRSCRERLHQLQAVFGALAELSDAMPSRDFSPAVMAHLPASRVPAFTPALAAQLGAVVGALIFIALKAAQIIRIPAMPRLSLPELSVEQLRLLISYPALLTPNFHFSIQVPAYSVSNFALAASNFESFFLRPVASISGSMLRLPPSLGNPIIVTTLFAMCLISNLLLLRNHEASQ